MKIIVPDYYEDFYCKKGECFHTCCANWQVDIDNDTLSYYDTLDPENKNWVKSHIKVKDGISYFERTASSRCPFLRDDGLCEMIIRLGPDALCDICLDHPLFRNYYSDRVEIGLGLCCESACELILKKSEPVEFLMAVEGDEYSLSPEDGHFFDLRNELISIAQDRSRNIPERLSEISSTAGFKKIDIPSFLSFLSTLEYLDKDWIEMLNSAIKVKDIVAIPDELYTSLEQFAVYIIYRNTHFSIDYSISLIYLCIYLVSAFPETAIEEIARLISSEIEYSDENPDKIVKYLINASD